MKYAISLILLVSLVLVMGCAPAEKGTLVMQITDAPADLNIEKALVTISDVEVNFAGGDENATTGWMTVVSEEQTFDLLQLVGVTELLGETQLAAGKYNQVRLSVTSAKVTIDGTEYDLEVPSDKLKLVKGFDIVAGETTTLTLDFDAKESVVATGVGKYLLKPTIKILSEEETAAKMGGKPETTPPEDAGRPEEAGKPTQ